MGSAKTSFADFLLLSLYFLNNRCIHKVYGPNRSAFISISGNTASFCSENAKESCDILSIENTDSTLPMLKHNVMGAGKSKKKRVFKGLTEAEKIRLAKFAGEEAMNRLSI